jgi:hypothetical protein
LIVVSIVILSFLSLIDILILDPVIPVLRRTVVILVPEVHSRWISVRLTVLSVLRYARADRTVRTSLNRGSTSTFSDAVSFGESFSDTRSFGFSLSRSVNESFSNLLSRIFSRSSVRHSVLPCGTQKIFPSPFVRYSDLPCGTQEIFLSGTQVYLTYIQV